MNERGPIEVIYITRKYPPSVGGMERLAADIASELGTRFSLRVKSLGRGQLHLLWWLPSAMPWLIRSMRRQDRCVVVFGDPVVATALIPFVGRRHGTAVVVHGLDLTFRLPGYRPVVRRALRRIDKIIAISRATAEVAHSLGIDPAAIEIVNPGIEASTPPPTSRAELVSRFGFAEDDLVLTTIGRLVPRKGVSWFVEHVLAQLSDSVRYVVAGPADASDLRELQDLIDRLALQDRVVLAGSVDEATRELLLAGADLFVMPNLPQPGDMEGFGLVAAEASVRGTLVIASRLEGIVDAVIDGDGGVLCEPGAVEEWIEVTRRLTSDTVERDRMAAECSEAAISRFAFDRLGNELEAVVRQVYGVAD